MQVLWSQILFYTLGGIIVASSIAVVVTQNIVRCALCLLVALGATSGLFFFLGADFVGAVQLLIYVGGTLVLVIFGVMLTAQGPFVRMLPRSGEWVIAAVVGLSLLSVLCIVIASTEWPPVRPVDEVDSSAAAAQSRTSYWLGLGFLGFTAPDPNLPRDPANIGYLLPFEIVSVHLLVVLIGAAYLARAKRRRTTNS